MTTLFAQPYGQRLGDFLKEHLRRSESQVFCAAIAFVKRSGVKHIVDELTEFAARGRVKIAVGVDLGGTSLEGLSTLFEAVDGLGEIWVFHNENGSTFHPKIYLFKTNTTAELVIGSGNLTEGGLYDNYEACIALSLDLADEQQRRFAEQVENTINSFCDPNAGTALLLTREVLDSLATQGYLPPEAFTRRAEEGAPVDPPQDDDAETATAPRLFQSVNVPAAPRVAMPGGATRRTRAEATGPVRGAVRETQPEAAATASVFYMTLQLTDVGVGQTTAGTSRRSPEVFIPLAARDFAPEFWDWPDGFVADPSNTRKMDRTAVPMLIGTTIASVNMMTWPAKSDFRLRSEVLRSAGSIGDVLRLERADGSRGYQYIATVIPRGTAQYAAALAKCVNSVRNSSRVWGYE